jgi:integrase
MTRKRRGRNEGSVYQRKSDGIWIASLSCGYDANGRRQRRISCGATKAEALEKLRSLVNSGAGPISDAERLTVAEYLARWLESTARPRIQPKTHLRYEQLIRLRICPHIGGVKLGKLMPLHIEQLFSTLEREGVSARGRQMVGTMLHTAMRDAARLRLIAFNPARDIAKPRPAKKKMQVYDAGQTAAFLAAAEKDRLYAMYVLAVDSGMRQGELFALQWPDIDFDTGSVQVQRSLEEINGHLRVKETKSASGRRRIDLSAFTLAALHEHRKRMLAEGNAGGPVFCDHQGGYLRKGNVLRRSFWPALDRAGLPRIRFHDLRHTCATLLLLSDVNVKVVSERLGHADIQLTLTTYTHVLPTMQKAAAAKMDGIFTARQAAL